MASRDMAANAEIASEKGRRFPRPGRKTFIALGIFLLLLLLAAGGAAWATHDYSQQYEGRLLPGTSIAGLDVAGLTYEEATDEARSLVGPQLHRRITIRWRDEAWAVTPKKLGARSNLSGVVDAAIRATERTSFLDRMQMSLFDEQLDFERDIAITYPGHRAKSLIDRIAEGIDRKARDAAIDYSSGWVDVIPERIGYEVQTTKSFRDLMGAMRNGGGPVKLSVSVLQPGRTAADFDQILLVRIGENKLYLYENQQITHEWTIATGQPEYMTPTGQYYVTEKRYMPTWVNPAPDTWGSDMPESIPPGPDNPLGLRAINWSAPAIRFHGTSATYSLGYNASHGCVRLSNGDAIVLYDMIDVGTPIVSVVAGELKPLYVSAPDPIPVPGDEEGKDQTAADSKDTAGANTGSGSGDGEKDGRGN